MEASAAIMVAVYLLLFGFLKYIDHQVKETATVKQQVFLSDTSKPNDSKVTLTPDLRDTGLENLLNDMDGYYSSKDGYSSKDSKDAIVMDALPNPLDRLFFPIIVPSMPPSPPPPTVTITPHVTDVNPPLN